MRASILVVQFCLLLNQLLRCLHCTQTIFSADRQVGRGELRSRGQDLHPLEGLPVAGLRQERPPLRVQQRQGGRQGVAPDGVGDEEATHEWRLAKPELYLCHIDLLVHV